VASEAGVSTVLFSMLDGAGAPEIQRIRLRWLTDPAVVGGGELFADGFESGDLAAWSIAAR